MRPAPETARSRKIVKIVLVLLLVLLAGIFFMLDLGRYLSLDFLKEQAHVLKQLTIDNRWLSMAVFLAIYIVVTAISLPGALVMTLAGGALFGLLTGTVLVSFGSTIGATLAFLLSRYLFRDLVKRKFSSRLAAIDRGIERDGGFYLFSLRLVPIFPFFIINLVMGVTSISTPLFYGISQLGMLPATIVYVNAGTALASIDSLSHILSARLIVSFALLGIFPLFARWTIRILKKRRIYRPYPKPAAYDYNLVVIGAGSAGLVAAYIAAAVKARVALIEASRMGGDCLNTGCVPSKALLQSARVCSLINRSNEFGIHTQGAEVNFKAVMNRIQDIIGQIAPNDSVERYTGLGVDCIHGRARIVSPFAVEVNNRRLTTRNIIVATGASPMIPDLEGLSRVPYHTSDTIWSIRDLPRRLLVLGGGPIGCELAQAFSRLGSRVTLVQRGNRILKKEDPDVSQLVQGQFESEGIVVLTRHAAIKIKEKDGSRILVCRNLDQTVEIPFDDLLIALGRKPNITGFGLEDLGVTFSQNNTSIETNELLQTNFPNIYCSGDVNNAFQFTHTASHESWYACVNALFGTIKSFRVDYGTIPWATYTEPEVARVGLNETQAKEKNINHEITIFDIAGLDRAITDGQARGFVKVITPKGKDTILGVTIAGQHAADIIAEYVLAMKQGIGLNKILGTIHIYPTMAEANKYAAGIWKKNHAPQKLLTLVKKFHAWKRKQA